MYAIDVLCGGSNRAHFCSSLAGFVGNGAAANGPNGHLFAGFLGRTGLGANGPKNNIRKIDQGWIGVAYRTEGRMESWNRHVVLYLCSTHTCGLKKIQLQKNCKSHFIQQKHGKYESILPKMADELKVHELYTYWWHKIGWQTFPNLLGL